MAGRGAKIEKIIEVLRAVEVLVSQEHMVAEACRKTNVTQPPIIDGESSMGDYG